MLENKHRFLEFHFQRSIIMFVLLLSRSMERSHSLCVFESYTLLLEKSSMLWLLLEEEDMK